MSSLFLCSLGHTHHPWYRVGGDHKGVNTRGRDHWGHFGGLLPQESFHNPFFECVCVGSYFKMPGRGIFRQTGS